MTTATETRSPSTLSPTRPRAALGVLVAALAIGVGLRAAFLLWHPPLDTDFYDYATVAPIGQEWYVMHFLVGAPGFLLAFPALSVLVAWAVRGGWTPLALVGGLVTSLGAVFFALGLAGEGAAWAWATDPGVIDAESGAALLRGMESRSELTEIPLVASSLVVLPLGVLLMLIALIGSRAIPRWIPLAAIGALVVGALPVPFPPLVNGVLLVVQSALLVVIGAVAARRS